MDLRVHIRRRGGTDTSRWLEKGDETHNGMEGGHHTQEATKKTDNDVVYLKTNQPKPLTALEVVATEATTEAMVTNPYQLVVVTKTQPRGDKEGTMEEERVGEKRRKMNGKDLNITHSKKEPRG